MTVLTDQARAAIVAEVMRTDDNCGGITKAQLREVVNAMDDWWETVAVAGNTAIPQPQRGILTQKQKASLFTRVLHKRYEVS